MAKRADVIVVGGGVVGCSIAYRLAERGRRVLLLERFGLAAGASGRNAGMTGAGSTLHARHGRAVYAVTSANFGLMRQLGDELETDFELRVSGSLDVATTPEQWAHLEHSVALQTAAGLDVRLLDRGEVQALVPALSDAILGAEYRIDRGHLWPFALVHGFAAAARRLRATIQSGANVTALARDPDGGRVRGVIVDGKRIDADEVVLATNAYTPHLLGDELPAGAIVPARGQILVTQPMPPLLAMPFSTNFDKEYGRQTPTGQILCGGYRRLDEDQGLGHETERVSPTVLAGLARCLTSLFPTLAGVNVVRAWAGIMGFTADGLPLIGKMPASPGLTVAAGFNGGGFSWAAITGQLVTDLVCDRKPAFDLAPFAPDRFATSGTAWNNPFTAGERSD